jgi:hypothetical protein
MPSNRIGKFVRRPPEQVIESAGSRSPAPRSMRSDASIRARGADPDAITEGLQPFVLNVIDFLSVRPAERARGGA